MLSGAASYGSVTILADIISGILPAIDASELNLTRYG